MIWDKNEEEVKLFSSVSPLSMFGKFGQYLEYT